MGKSTFISAALHTAILLFVIVAFPSAKMDGGPLVAIPVGLSNPAEDTKTKAGMRDAKDEMPLAGKPEVKKPEAAKEKAAKSSPEETASITKDSEKGSKPKPKEAAKPKESPAAPEVQRPTPKPAKPVKKASADKPKKPKPAPKKRDFNPDTIAALLNKIPDAENAPEPQELAEETAPARGQSNGTHMTMSASELDALRSRIADCWSPPPGGLGAESIVVKLRLKLNEDGTLIGYPSVTNNGSSPFFQAAADSAVRAVYQCQPYELPKAKYALWRDMILNFDPSEMYRNG